MDLPKIELSSLPDLDLPTGLFGSLADGFRAAYSDDRIVDLMTFVYEILPPKDLF